MDQVTADYRHAQVMYHDACWRLFKAAESRKTNQDAVAAAQEAVRSARVALRAVTPSCSQGVDAFPCRGK